MYIYICIYIYIHIYIYIYTYIYIVITHKTSKLNIFKRNFRSKKEVFKKLPVDNFKVTCGVFGLGTLFLLTLIQSRKAIPVIVLISHLLMYRKSCFKSVWVCDHRNNSFYQKHFIHANRFCSISSFWPSNTSCAASMIYTNNWLHDIIVCKILCYLV